MESVCALSATCGSEKRSSTFSLSYLQHLIVLMVGDVFFILYLLNPTLSPQYSSVCSCLTVDIFLIRIFFCFCPSSSSLLLFLTSISSLSLEMNRISWFLRNNKIIFSIFTFYLFQKWAPYWRCWREVTQRGGEGLVSSLAPKLLSAVAFFFCSRWLSCS